MILQVFLASKRIVRNNKNVGTVSRANFTYAMVYYLMCLMYELALN